MRDASGRLIPVDDPNLDAVFDAAGELEMPIAIHTGDPLRFWDPPTEQNERYRELLAHPGWSLYGRGVPSFDELYAALERRFARHPKTTFISVHFGNLAEDPARVAATLRKYPNVYIDTSARIPEMGRHDPAAMRAFFEEFQDRILFGSDLGVGPEPSPLFLGSSGENPPTPEETELFFSATRRYFETSDVGFPHPTPIQGDWRVSGVGLSDAILHKVFHQNAERLLRLELD
jgi:predicted TIM-barrel fold metal-dependent hydrolase